MNSQKLNFSRLAMTRRHRVGRAGLGLIEVLVGLTVTLIVLGAMAGAFRFASQEMAKGRASLELTNRLRTVESLLRSDLRRLTVELKPYHLLPARPEGYAEIVDGILRDAPATPPAVPVTDPNLLLGDFDDVFAGTIRSDGRAFRGRFMGGVQESHLAEVVWFTTFSDANGNGVTEPNQGEQIRLFRRQLIVRPSLGILSAFATLPEVNEYIQNNDVSCRVEFDVTNNEFRITANSLEDLTLRRNRYAHNFSVYPQGATLNVDLLRLDDQYLNPLVFVHRRASDQSDLLLSDVAAFDIRVFDPLAAVAVDIADVAEPTEFGWGFAGGTVGPRIGAYVDLGKPAGGVDSSLDLLPTVTRRVPLTGTLVRGELTYAEAVFDTGTSAYDSINNATLGAVPVGTNGIDDDTDGAVDEDDEKIAPPYSIPIRGVEVVIRLYEPNSGQATQMTLRQSMMPQ